MSGPAALEFTEVMKGFVAVDETDPERGYASGRRDGTSLAFRLTIRTDDVDAFLDRPGHDAGAVGYVDCDALGGRRDVEKGTFNLFVGAGPGARRMLYRLPFADAAGHPLTLTGYKDVHDDKGFDVWRDTSTLYTTVLAGHVETADDAQARVVAAGILTIHLPDFLHQLTTFRASTDSGPAPAALARFGRFFLGELADVYGHRLGREG